MGAQERIDGIFDDLNRMARFEAFFEQKAPAMPDSDSAADWDDWAVKALDAGVPAKLVRFSIRTAIGA